MKRPKPQCRDRYACPLHKPEPRRVLSRRPPTRKPEAFTSR